MNLTEFVKNEFSINYNNFFLIEIANCKWILYSLKDKFE